MFSIIIPLYNKALYIEKAVQSVLAQTFRGFELIIVNDGSTDNGLEIIEKIKGETEIPITIINQSNQGVSAARNNGVKLAKHEFIAFLDADDWWEPTFLEEMRKIIFEYPDAGIYGCSYYWVKNKRKNTLQLGFEEFFEKGYIDYFSVYVKKLYMPLWTSAVIVRKEIFDKEQGFNPLLKLGEDFDLWARIALNHKVAFLNKPLANYNQDVALVNRAIGKLHNPDTHMLWNLGYFEEKAKSEPVLKQLLDNLRVYSLYPYFLSNKYRESARKELDKVDWSKQSYSKYKRYYMIPISFLKIERFIKICGSKIKNRIFKIYGN